MTLPRKIFDPEMLTRTRFRGGATSGFQVITRFIYGASPARTFEHRRADVNFPPEFIEGFVLHRPFWTVASCEAALPTNGRSFPPAKAGVLEYDEWRLTRMVTGGAKHSLLHKAHHSDLTSRMRRMPSLSRDSGGTALLYCESSYMLQNTPISGGSAEVRFVREGICLPSGHRGVRCEYRRVLAFGFFSTILMISRYFFYLSNRVVGGVSRK